MRSQPAIVQGIAGAAGLIAAITLLSRVAGFGRVLVFADSVGAEGVGEIYQSVNALPGVLFEIAAGGVLAAVAVPLIAHRLGAGDRARADQIASVLMTWTTVILAPLAVLLFLAAGPIAEILVDDFDARAQPVAAMLLRIFAIQVPLYGVGIVLTGVLHAHRRFLAAALAPLMSSIVVLTAYLVYGSMTTAAQTLGQVSDTAVQVLGWGTTAGVVALSVPLVIPARRTGWRWRVALRLERDERRRVGALASAGVLALLGQQACVLATMWLTNHAGERGVFVVYQYVQALYLLPYAVLAVPIATSVFPALAERVGAADLSAVTTLSRSLRALVLVSAGAAAVLMAVAAPAAQFFTALDRTRSESGGAALAAMSGALVAYAPGLVGFSLAALLTRATYVQGRPLRAAAAMGFGWGIAALMPPMLLASGASAGVTLGTLGIASSAGMTTAALLLVLLVRQGWGSAALTGLARSAGVAIVSAATALASGQLLASRLEGAPLGGRGAGLWGAVLDGVIVAAVAGGTYVAVAWLGDRSTMQELRARGRSRRASHRGSGT